MDHGICLESEEGKIRIQGTEDLKVQEWCCVDSWLSRLGDQKVAIRGQGDPVGDWHVMANSRARSDEEESLKGCWARGRMYCP